MTNETIGARIARYRKEKQLTQDGLAEKLGVSPQAVSKWENNQSCPDILLLPAIADLFGISTDTLLRGEEPETRYLAPEERRDFNKLMLRIKVDAAEGDTVRVNLPMPLIKLVLETGMKIPGMKIGSTELGDLAQQIDLKQIVFMVEQGMIGKLVEVRTSDGTSVEIVVE